MGHYKKTILHVDDDPQITRFVAHHLCKAGYEVTSLNDPEAVMETLGKSQHRLVILDIDMPRINGLDLLRKIKSVDGGTQVIILTGLVSMQTALRSYRWGAEFCFFKPITDFGPLRQAIEAVFWKIDQWWLAIDYVSQQKRSSSDSPPAPTQDSVSLPWLSDTARERIPEAPSHDLP